MTMFKKRSLFFGKYTGETSDAEKNIRDFSSTAGNVKLLYESNPNTNAFTDILKARVQFVEKNILFVDKNGNDITGDGTADNPYLTIQKAIDTVDNDEFFVNNLFTKISVGSGNFSGFIVNKTGIIIDGGGGSMGLPFGATISGLITLDCAIAPFFIQMHGIRAVVESGNGINNVNAALFAMSDCFLEGGEDANSIGLNHSGIGTISIIN